MVGRPRIFPDEVYEKARANRIPLQHVYKRIVELGWSHERASTEPIMSRSQAWRASMRDRVKEHYTPEEYKLMRKHKLKTATVTRRIHTLGWSRRKALTTPTRRYVREQPQEEVAAAVEEPDYIELNPEEYRKRRREILKMLNHVQSESDYERIGLELARLKRVKE